MTYINPRVADYPVHPLFVQRWSPRAFNNAPLNEETLFALFEAARWAPSANNSQPWRFVYALKDSPTWPQFFALLGEKNQRWAANASALVILLSKTSHIKRGEETPSRLRSHSLDAGAAWAHLALQAELSGWRTHAIGGFDKDKARELLEIPAEYHVEVAIAIGQQADLESLPPDLQAREQPNQRRPVREFVAEGKFAFVD